MYACLALEHAVLGLVLVAVMLLAANLVLSLSLFSPVLIFLATWPGILVKWHPCLGLRIARYRVRVLPGSWSGQVSLPL